MTALDLAALRPHEHPHDAAAWIGAAQLVLHDYLLIPDACPFITGVATELLAAMAAQRAELAARGAA